MEIQKIQNSQSNPKQKDSAEAITLSNTIEPTKPTRDWQRTDI